MGEGRRGGGDWYWGTNLFMSDREKPPLSSLALSFHLLDFWLFRVGICVPNSEFLWLLNESQETKKTNILRQNPSCLTGFYVQSKYQGILFVVYQSLRVDFQYFCYHYNKLRVISLNYEHGSGANVFTNILQGFLSWFQEETVYMALKNRSSLLSASEAVTTPVMIAHHCIWVPGRATCRTKSAKISRTLVQIMLVLIAAERPKGASSNIIRI